MDGRSFAFYKETALGLICLYCFHQCGIPHRMCRFYLLLAGAPKDEGEGLCGAPLLHGTTLAWFTGLHLLTPGNPLRRGILAAAVDRDIGSLYPVQTVHPHFDVVFGCFVFGLKLFAFQKITPGICLSFFIGGGCTVRSCGYGRFCYGLSLGLPLTAPFLPISLDASPFHQLCWVEEYRKKRVRAACASRKWVSHPV